MNSIYGIQNQRSKPRIEVPRGYIGVESSNALTAAYPVTSGVTVLSGQLIQPSNEADGLSWILGGDPDTDFTAIPQFYFAINDSQDEDVLEAGKLPALSSNGQYEIETAFVTAGDYAPGDLLVPDSANPGNVKEWDGNDTDGAGENIVGEVVAVLTAAEVKAKNSNVNPAFTGTVLRVRTPARQLA